MQSVIKRTLRPWVWKFRILQSELFPTKAREERVSWHIYSERARLWNDTEAQFDAILSKLGPESICLDCGANVGEMTRRMAKTGATVHAFEPDPYTFARLSEAVADFPNVTLHQAAVGASDGTLTLSRHAGFEEDPEAHSISTGAFRSVFRDEGGDSFDVPMIGFRGFLRGLGRPADLIKMDIEGAEVEILEDILDSEDMALVGPLFVETHEAQIPELRRRTMRLHRRVAKLPGTTINLNWR